MECAARFISDADLDALARAFAGTPWDRGRIYFARLLSQHREGSRQVWVGLADGSPVGFGSLLHASDYPPFREQHIPEIQDLNVAPRFRRRGIASRILDRAETQAFERGDRIGIGVGLHPGYRAAQRMYALRGYVPDGRGVYSRGRFPEEGETVTLDDDLVLHLVKVR